MNKFILLCCFHTFPPSIILLFVETLNFLITLKLFVVMRNSIGYARIKTCTYTLTLKRYMKCEMMINCLDDLTSTNRLVNSTKQIVNYDD